MTASTCVKTHDRRVELGGKSNNCRPVKKKGVRPLFSTWGGKRIERQPDGSILRRRGKGRERGEKCFGTERKGAESLCGWRGGGGGKRNKREHLERG